MAEERPDTSVCGPDAHHRAALAQGRILLQRSRSDGRCFFYPRVAAPGTGETTFDWIEASGAGTVNSTTVVRRKPQQGGDYNIALVTLDEGPRLLSQVVDTPPDSVAIGQRVSAHVGAIDGEPAILFRPAGVVS